MMYGLKISGQKESSLLQQSALILVDRHQAHARARGPGRVRDLRRRVRDFIGRDAYAT